MLRSKIISNRKRNARIEAGLTAEPVDVKNMATKMQVPTSIEYGNFNDSLKRLEDREMSNFRIRDYLDNENTINHRRTLEDVNNERKEQMMKDYDEKYASKFVPGINKNMKSFEKHIKSSK